MVVAGAKAIQTLRHTITLTQEAEIKLKYKDLNDDGPSVIQISTTPQADPTVMSMLGQHTQLGNQTPSENVARLN